MELPKIDPKYEARITRLSIMQVGQPLFSELTTLVEIDDEAAGEFVKVQQQGGHVSLEKCLAIDPEEWPTIRWAIEFMVNQCKDSTDG